MHTIVLMHDGELVIHRKDAAPAGTEAGLVEAVREMMGRAVKSGGCFRLTVEGPEVNGGLTLDAPRPPKGGPGR